MPRFFRKVRMQLPTGNRLGKYFMYAMGEILLVVIGILIALQINNWNNQRIERQEEQKSYRNIKQQILEDKSELVQARDFNSYYSKVYGYGIKIISEGDLSKKDSLALVAMGLSQYSTFNRNGTIYETLVNSGQLKLLKNTTITRALQKLETSYNLTKRLEDIHWELIINEVSPELKGVINYTTGEVVRPEQLYGVALQNIFYEIIGLTQLKDTLYGRALKEIDMLTRYIDTELGLETRIKLSE